MMSHHLKKKHDIKRFDAILGHLRPGSNHKAIVQLFKKMRMPIFDAPRLALPSERMKNGWNVLYDSVGKAMEDAIAQLGTEEEHDRKQR